MNGQQGVKLEDSSPQSAVQDPNNPQMVPKERLDELIARVRNAESQNGVLQHILRQVMPQGGGQPGQPQKQEEPEHWQRIKESDPNLYQELKAQAAELKQTRATTFTLIDDSDRQKFLGEFGDVGGREAIAAVEQKLGELRARGIHHFNRGQIFIHMKGVDAVMAGKRGNAQPQNGQPQNTAPTPNNPVPSNAPPQGGPATRVLIANAPGTDPSAAGVPRSSSAGSTPPRETLEELEARLANVVF